LIYSIIFKRKSFGKFNNTLKLSAEELKDIDEKMKIEQMSNFFTARVDGYDEHMIKTVEVCKEGYIKMAELLPKEVNELLDLGCGTGLELNEIFKNKLLINVTGIDLT
jgi:tRNA (cmo5U34)-methyltransferase